MPEAKPNLQTASGAGGVYTLFSTLIPSTLLLSFDRVSRDSFEFLNTIPWWFVLIALACNIAASGVLSFLTGKHAGFSSFVRVNFFIYFLPSHLAWPIPYRPNPATVPYLWAL